MTSDIAMYTEKADAYFDFARTDIAPLLPDRMDRVLEIGCGAGATLKWLRSQHSVRHAVGIEVVPEMAKRAASVFDVVLSDNVETMELPSGSFDVILALDVLEHLVDPWSVVRRLHRLLNPDGVIIASIPNIGHYSVSVPLVLRGRWNYTPEGLLDQTHLRFFTGKTAVELLTCSGLIHDMTAIVRRGPKFRSAKARWYSLKILTWLLPGHLLNWQFLIRVKAT
jgi:2-polyprenyl-3-methyl-5-hydroxy-6-metoxy-1,4-benzoquinol methylase